MNESLEVMNLKDLQTLNPGWENHPPLVNGGLKAALVDGVPFQHHPIIQGQPIKITSDGTILRMKQEFKQPSPSKQIAEFSKTIEAAPQEHLTKSNQNNCKKRRIVFFVVHGLEATSFDMRHIRAAILANVPNSMVYLVQDNTDLTNNSIEVQGKRMATEIKELLKSHGISGET